MDDATRTMVKGWVAMDGNNTEKTARWMVRELQLGTLAQCRGLIKQALAV